MHPGLDEQAVAYVESCRAYGDGSLGLDVSASPQWAARGMWGGVPDLTMELLGLVEAARAGAHFAGALLIDLVVRSAAVGGSVRESAPSSLLLAPQVESFMADATMRATATGDDWSVSGAAWLMGVDIGTHPVALVPRVDESGAILVALTSSALDNTHAPPGRAQFRGLAVAGGDVLARLDSKDAERVRQTLSLASIAVLVGISDAHRPAVASILRAATSGQPDRWAGQARKHALADMASLREVAWLEMFRGVSAQSTEARDLHAAVGLCEALDGVRLTLEAASLPGAADATGADRRLRSDLELVDLLDTLAGGRLRLKDRISDYVLDARLRRPA